MAKYDFKKIEKKWQKRWLEDKAFSVGDGSSFGGKAKPKFYQLETFPYPSAEGLHVGHPKGYIAEDVHARYMRMRGKEVLYSIGWDAFGLPTENYAIRVGKNPKEVAEANIKNFKRQVQMFGLSYDWDREINTSDPEYYKWTQWLFLELYKKGLAYRAKAKVNWCPSDMTVLANEQVVQKDGKNVCERCKSEVVQKDMAQWFLKIMDYVERLLSDLKNLDWPEATIKRQKDWIGKSEGAEIRFEVKGERLEVKPNFVLLHGFTGSTRKNYFPWLSGELRKRGLDFYAPDLPNTESPTEEEQVSFVLKNAKFDRNTILFGHSLGTVVAMKVLEKLEQPIAGVILAGGFIRPPSTRLHNRNYEKTFTWKFDFKKIKSNIGFVKVLVDEKDDRVLPSQTLELYENLGGELIKTVANRGHFCGVEEPKILDALVPSIRVFTTRADTLFGATYLVISPEHKLLENNELRIRNYEEVKSYIEKAKKKTELERMMETKEKTGVELGGVKAINPATKEEIPVWVADYVLGSYGAGAIMAVPAHDERDFEFAKKFDLPIRMVICPHYPAKTCPVLDKAYIGEGHLVDSGKFDGMDSGKAKWEITKEVGGEKKVQYKIRDWSVSRQRYWGVPIPMVHCVKCGIQPVADKDLPVLLPDLEDYRPKGKPPLASSEKFIKTNCPKCGGKAEREPETLDTFVDSSWYYLRYTDPKNAEEIFDKKKVNHWMPVDLYVIGAEHAVLHLLYSRFITKFLHDEGYLKFTEPFLKLRHVGLIRGSDGQKMSKSRGNVVNPDTLIKEFGADSFRVYEMFMGPFEDGQPWDPQGILGAERFLKRIHRFFEENKEDLLAEIASPHLSSVGPENVATKRQLSKSIKKITEDILGLHFNTAISTLMTLLYYFEADNITHVTDFEKFLKLLHPFAPHMTQEIWEALGHKDYITFAEWPEYDPKLIKDETFTLVVQINGRVRDTVEAEAEISQAEAEKLALGREKVSAYLKGVKPKKVIFVPGRLINLVV